MDKQGCQHSKPGQGDCAHFFALPFPEDETTCDEYGKPHDWCWWCWLVELKERAERKCQQVEEYLKEADLRAEKLITELFHFVLECDADEQPKWLGLDMKWTREAGQALRFARRIDAESFAKIAMQHCHPPAHIYPMVIFWG